MKTEQTLVRLNPFYTAVYMQDQGDSDGSINFWEYLLSFASPVTCISLSPSVLIALPSMSPLWLPCIQTMPFCGRLFNLRLMMHFLFQTDAATILICAQGLTQ